MLGPGVSIWVVAMSTTLEGAETEVQGASAVDEAQFALACTTEIDQS